MALLPASLAASGRLEVFLATSSGTILVVDELKAEDQVCELMM